MEKDKPMRLLLIEDDLADALKYSDVASRRAYIEFIAITDCSEEGISLVKSGLPEGVILDLQLVKGKGSGLQFLELLNKDEDLTFVPLVAVTTSNSSESVRRCLEELGADWYFCKTSQGYDENLVIDTLLTLRPSIDAKQKKGGMRPLQEDLVVSRGMVESLDERRERIYRRIDTELDLIGVRAKLKGREYLREAIYAQVNSDNDRGSGIEEVADMYKRTYSATLRTMQTAINNTWNNADPEDLMKHYTASISAKNGVPYALEFIHHYAERIRNSV